jgi:hypothetical protein
MPVNRTLIRTLACLATLGPASAGAEMRVDKVPCLGQANCLRLSNGDVEVVVTTDIGPRIVRYALTGGENILGEALEAVTKTELGEWKPWAGHRLWHAPESNPRSYAPDDAPVRVQIVGNRHVSLTQLVEARTGIEKRITVTLDSSGSRVSVAHVLTNRNLWDVELAPWALTIMRGGGTAIVPQEPYGAHSHFLLPVRPLALWAYTDLSDPRFTIGRKYIRVRSDAQRTEPQKIGIGSRQGWAAYSHGRTVFLKRFPYRHKEVYPDFGSSCEVFTAGTFIELETLGPLVRLEPDAIAQHFEEWELFGDMDIGTSEESIEAALGPRVHRAVP